MYKVCKECGQEKPLEAFSKVTNTKDDHRGVCKQCINKRHYNRTDQAKKVQRASRLQQQYNMTLEEYDILSEAQNNLCATCHKTCSTGARLVVDHDHQTGKVRGLLCRNCNLMLGNARDTVETLLEAVKYLIKSKE